MESLINCSLVPIVLAISSVLFLIWKMVVIILCSCILDCRSIPFGKGLAVSSLESLLTKCSIYHSCDVLLELLQLLYSRMRLALSGSTRSEVTRPYSDVMCQALLPSLWAWYRGRTRIKLFIFRRLITVWIMRAISLSTTLSIYTLMFYSCGCYVYLERITCFEDSTSLQLTIPLLYLCRVFILFYLCLFLRMPSCTARVRFRCG